ncbi:MAG TPA: hypothetical protein DDY17_01920 [Syntrophaceae bacterium]|nr:hypothetical protein [Syntrophaceae bacterium]
MQVKYKDGKNMIMIMPVEEILLPNGLKVEVWDTSLPIAGDTTKVELLIRIRVELQPSYFIKPEHFEIFRKIMGPEIVYEYSKKRAFVDNKEKDTVFRELIESFKKGSLPYLANPKFPQSFALSKYWDIEKNRHRLSIFS